MDEASIVIALQEKLQDYKVRTQIRRKESQMHILLTREEGDDLDYAHLYDIVKDRIDNLPIEWANSFIVYGRLSGTKQPEWQREGNIKPTLPLIELDLDDLDDLDLLDEAESLNLSIAEDATLEHLEDLDDRELDDKLNDQGRDFLALEENLNLEDIKLEDLEFNILNPDSLNPDNLKLNKTDILDSHDSEDIDSLESDALDFHDITLSENISENNISATSTSATNTSAIIDDFNNSNQRSLEVARDDVLIDVDAELAPTELAPPSVPLPPPLPPIVRPPTKIPANPNSEIPELLTQTKSKKPFLLSLGIVGVSLTVIGVCGLLLWGRSSEQQVISDARNLINKNFNLQQIGQLEELTETRNKLQSAVTSLEAIPDRPLSLYADAQSELTALRPKLEGFDRKVNVEQDANKKLESSKAIALEAAKMTQNAPHRSIIWQSALEKRQQSIKLLEDIPVNSLLYPKAQERLKAYRPELLQISKWAEIQKRAETSASSVRPETVSQIKRLKLQVTEKSKFLSQCSTLLQPQMTSSEFRQTGLPTNKLAEYLCAYFWSLD